MVEASELRTVFTDLRERLDGLCRALDLEGAETRGTEIESAMSAPGFWDNQDTAQGLIEELKRVKAVSDPLAAARAGLTELEELFELAEAEDDAETRAEVAGEVEALVRTVDGLETRALLCGANDAKDAFFSLHAGAGGDDACECAELLSRMYLRFFERRSWKVEEIDWIDGENAGLRSATYRVSGDHVYGYLRSEMGVHRIVRMSPFSGKRETSFVGVDVVPEYEDADIEIDEGDLRIDTYRSSGKGGQHVNKTDSAVRITHLPTGVVVAVQNERSQHKNKAMGMKLLRAKLQRVEEAKREKEIAAMYSEKGEISFGSQIRNYVFQPYTMVKDGRTGFENGNIQDVMDGNLDGFVEAYLKWDVERRQ